jgi:hypothetical protein
MKNNLHPSKVGKIKSALALTLTALALLFGPRPAVAQSNNAPFVFTYQGILTDSNGAVVPSGGVIVVRPIVLHCSPIPCISFSTNITCWTCPPYTTNGTGFGQPITNNYKTGPGGGFTMEISMDPSFLETNLGGDLYLQMYVGPDDQSLVQLWPPQLVTSTPFAAVASSLSGPLPASSLSGTVASTQLQGVYDNVLIMTNTNNVLAGDGSQLANVNATTVGGQTAVSILGGVSAANAATSANIPGAIVARDTNGNISAGSINLSGALNLPFPAVLSSGGTNFLIEEGSLYMGFNDSTTPQPSTALHNTGFGDWALRYDASTSAATGSYNAAMGEGALGNNTSGSGNMAAGFEALTNNYTGSYNTASGYETLWRNTNGSYNTATGAYALQYDTGSSYNTATGAFALWNDASGSFNTANGYLALYIDSSGFDNTATGASALQNDTTGSFNTANGYLALYTNSTGSNNTATGLSALQNNTTGSGNIALGYGAGLNLATGHTNIYIGNQGTGEGFYNAENYTIRIGATNYYPTNTYIAGIYGNVNFDGTPLQVYVDAGGHLGVQGSSERFKQNIRSMDDASDTLLSLRPVTYQYKPGYDPKGRAQYGLVAEEVDKVDPNLVVHDDQHGIYTVRYDAVNAMMLNEVLKQHRKVEDQKTEIQDLKQQNDSLAQRLQELEAAVKSITKK